MFLSKWLKLKKHGVKPTNDHQIISPLLANNHLVTTIRKLIFRNFGHGPIYIFTLGLPLLTSIVFLCYLELLESNSMQTNGVMDPSKLVLTQTWYTIKLIKPTWHPTKLNQGLTHHGPKRVPACSVFIERGSPVWSKQGGATFGGDVISSPLS